MQLRPYGNVPFHRHSVALNEAFTAEEVPASPSAHDNLSLAVQGTDAFTNTTKVRQQKGNCAHNTH